MLARHLVLLLFVATAGAQTSRERAYGDVARDIAIAARDRDWAALERHTDEGLGLRPGYPTLLLEKARAQVGLNELDSAMAILRRLAVMGLDFDVTRFTGLADHAGVASVTEIVAANRRPVGALAEILRLDERDFVPEGIAYEPGTRAHFLGSVRKAKIVRVAPDGRTTEFANETAGLWSVFGLRVEARTGLLWAATSAVREGEDVDVDDVGRAALVAFSLENGAVAHRIVLPVDDRRHVLGDVLPAPDGTLYTTDSLTGTVWAADRTAASFRILVAPGTFVSPQGLALTDDARALIVADYRGPLRRVDLATGRITTLASPDDACVFGIDGLYRSGATLIAVQNGISPHRVVAMELAADGTAVTAVRVLAANDERFDEPTLGTVAGGTFHFVANSHWGRFGRNGSLGDRDSLSPPIVLGVPLPRE